MRSVVLSQTATTTSTALPASSLLCSHTGKVSDSPKVNGGLLGALVQVRPPPAPEVPTRSHPSPTLSSLLSSPPGQALLSLVVGFFPPQAALPPECSPSLSTVTTPGRVLGV